jgi:hypothetical protein
MSGRAQRRWAGRFLPALAVLLAGGALAVAFSFRSVSSPAGGAEAAARTDDLFDAPDPVEPAFVPGPPRPLGAQDDVSRYAPVLRPTAARAGPNAAADVVAHLETRTPEGTRNVVLVLRRAIGTDGRVWVRVRLPVLPNGRTGWVARDALGGYGSVRTHLVVDLEGLTATLFRDGRPVFTAVVGVGRPEWPTPRGEFYIRNKLTKYANAFYGPLAFGTSARSGVFTDWPAGGFVGVHGTNRPDLLPGLVSHGCIRLRNDDILELGRLMPVGTPLTVR